MATNIVLWLCKQEFEKPPLTHFELRLCLIDYKYLDFHALAILNHIF